jgi:hypothetical protein
MTALKRDLTAAAACDHLPAANQVAYRALRVPCSVWDVSLMNVDVIVKSAAKAQTINKYLGRDFNVIACYGHVRDLPPKDGSVDPDNDFAMLWEMDAKEQSAVSAMAQCC